MDKVRAADAKVDYEKVRAAIQKSLENLDYEDGSYGPVLVRLAWHASGTYDKNSKTGGSNGAAMRFQPEAGDPGNYGLAVARAVLEPIKRDFPGITYADLWTLAGAVAVESMGGPKVPWRPGRTDAKDKSSCVTGRLPDATQGAKHLRDVFYRMGFNDQEIVALSGAHTLGRCHTDRSGFEGPWTNAPTTFSNLFFKELLERKWTERKWWGPRQYQDETGALMMLPTDMALVEDKEFKKWVDVYAKDQNKFYADFAAAFSKLLELGVPAFEPGAKGGTPGQNKATQPVPIDHSKHQHAATESKKKEGGGGGWLSGWFGGGSSDKK